MITTTQDNTPPSFEISNGRPRFDLTQIQQIVEGQQGRVVEIQDISREKEVVLHALRKGIVGQDTACEKISDIMDIGLNRTVHRKGPLGVVFLAGPTGVGKTETVKVLAERLLGDSNAFTRVDCEQLQEAHTARTLFGAPPSYVGHEQVPSLSGKNVYKPFEVGKKANKLHPIIKGKADFGIILFDEIEKAHPKVRQSLLSLLDEGKITFANGTTTSYENVLIVLTSNVGEQERVQQKSKNPIGFNTPSSHSKNEEEDESFKDAMRKEFSPEFIGRVGEPIRYQDITKENCSQIVRQQVESLNDYIGKYFAYWNMHVGVSDEAINFIVEKGFTKDEGARPLSRAIAKYISTPVNRTIKKYSGEDFLTRINPSVLYFDMDVDGERLIPSFHTPELFPEPISEDADEEDITTTTLDLVQAILGDVDRIREIHHDLREDGFSLKEIEIIMHLDQDYLSTSIFETEGFIDDGIDIYADAHFFEKYAPRDIRRLVDKKAGDILEEDDYSKHIFILTLIVKSIQTVESLLNSTQLSREQENIIIRFATHAVAKFW